MGRRPRVVPDAARGPLPLEPRGCDLGRRPGALAPRRRLPEWQGQPVRPRLDARAARLLPGHRRCRGRCARRRCGAPRGRVGGNPFTASVRLRLTLAAPGPVRAEAFDVLGRRVAVLLDGDAAGDVVLELRGGALAPGVYMVRVVTAARRAHAAARSRSADGALGRLCRPAGAAAAPAGAAGSDTVKHRSQPRRALDGDRARHALDKLARDRQAQARALVAAAPARGGLLERLVERREKVGGSCHARVGDAEVHAPPVARTATRTGQPA